MPGHALDARCLRPRGKRTRAEMTISRGTQLMTAPVDQISNETVELEQTLGMRKVSKPFHLSLFLSCRPMRCFTPIVRISRCVVRHIGE